MNLVRYYLYFLICFLPSIICFLLPAKAMDDKEYKLMESPKTTPLQKNKNKDLVENKDYSPIRKFISYAPEKRPFSILLIEEGENSLGIYHSETKKEIGRIYLNFFPHEIEVSPDRGTAYVSNFGIRDYDMKIGHPGNCISIIDLINLCEVDRLYTICGEKKYWGPHGLKVHPKGQKLYVNVECINGRYPSSNGPQEAMMLVFDLETKEVENSFPSRADFAERAYPLLAGTHNFLFTPLKDPKNDEDTDIWYYAGANGVTCINSETGEIKKHYPTSLETPISTNSQVFNGPVRGLAFNVDGTALLVSAKNELAVIDLSTESTGGSIKKFGDLGVGQLFYSKFIPQTDLVLAPAARESQVLVVNVNPQEQKKDRVTHRIVTGIDPLQVTISPIDGEKRAYVTNANSSFVSELCLNEFKEIYKIPTKGGANGIAFSKNIPTIPDLILTLGACLPFTGQYAAEGRECRIGLQFWQEAINKAGGLIVNEQRYKVDVCYGDTESKADEKELESIFSSFIKNPPNVEEILIMFGTYPSSANLILAKVLNSYDIPLITSTGREPSLFNQGFKNVFGISPLKQESDLKDAFMAIYKHVSPKPRTAMILSCDLCDAYEEAQALATYLKNNGVKVLSPFQKEKTKNPPIIKFNHCPAYKESTEIQDLNALMAKISQEAHVNCQYYPDLLFVSGHRKESATIINACARENFTYGAMALNAGITSYHFLTQVNAPVENLFGSVCWAETCSDFARDRFVASTDFQRMFYDRYSETPSELVAGFAASGVVVESALKKTPRYNRGEGFLPANLINALEKVEFDTFYGPIKFNENGANIKKPMITVQLRIVDSKLKGIPVWPLSIAGKERPKLPSAQH